MECNACGAILEGDSLARAWTCSYCKTVNHNKEFLKQHISSIDFAKTHNLLQVGLVAYECGDYVKAKDILEKILIEDSSNIDAWIYTALSTAFLTNISNFEESFNKIKSYIKKAESIDYGAPVLYTAKSVCGNLLGEIAKKNIERQYDFAKKSWFSYESVDINKAKHKTNEELSVAFKYADYGLSMKPDDLKVLGAIIILTLLCDQLYKGNNPHKEIVSKAKDALCVIEQNGLKEKLYSLLDLEYKEQNLIDSKCNKKNDGCFAQVKMICLWALGVVFILFLISILI